MRVGILGFGSLGRAAELVCLRNKSVELAGIFTRREPQYVGSVSGRVYPVSRLKQTREEVDVLLVCLGSSHGLTEAVLGLLEDFNTVDVYDNHGELSDHLSRLDRVARSYGRVALGAVGWDPGLLSCIRAYGSAFLGEGSFTTFWGPGVSQGHTEALKRVAGVRDALQITVPDERAMSLASGGVNVGARIRHRRKCYIIPDSECEKDRITNAVLDIDGYFKGQRVDIEFTDDLSVYRTTAHRGRVICRGERGESMNFDLELPSNAEFTAQVMVACANAALKLAGAGRFGSYSLLDIPPSLLLDGGGLSLL